MRALHDVAAPAKLNLFLHVTGRRPDGYHLLQSAFVLIDWCDTLHVEQVSSGELSREDLGDALPEDDLILRAARALQEASGTGLGARIGVQKAIPSQAGLGGGSSDAASTLLALNRLWGLHWPLSRLEELGLRLGADVPFFLRGRNAWVEGIGEEITPVELPQACFRVVKPSAGIATASIFAHERLRRNTDAARITGFAANPYRFGRNDLQPVAESLCAEVGEALQWLEVQGLEGRMTGSGSAIFALLPTGSVEAPPAPCGWKVRDCSKMEVHPLVGWAPSEKMSVGG